MAASSKAGSQGSVDEVTKIRICREFFTKVREALPSNIKELDKHDNNVGLRMYFEVENDECLSHDALMAATVCQLKFDAMLVHFLGVIDDDLRLQEEEAEQALDMKRAMEAAEAKKTAKPEKSDNVSTDYTSTLQKDMQNMQKSLRVLTKAIEGFRSSTMKQEIVANNSERISTPCGVNRRYSKQDLSALRVIEIQELQMESIRCRNSRYKHGRTKWVRNWEKDNSNCWNIFQRKPKSWSPSSIADPEYFSQRHRFADPRQNSESGLRNEAPEFVPGFNRRF